MIHQTETSKAKILLIEVPEDANCFRMWDIPKNILYFDTNEGWDGMDSAMLPSGNWSILAPLNDVTEEQARLVCYPTIYENRGYDKSIVFAFENLYRLASSLGIKGNVIVLYELKN